jgi:hypothetical protein
MTTSGEHTSENDYQRDYEVFGDPGRLLRQLSRDAWNRTHTQKYGFLDSRVFEEMLRTDVKMANLIYWGEVLQRAHSIALLSLRRHEKWQEGCIAAFTGDGNYLVFGTALRGMLEAALDGYYSMRGLPMTLAQEHKTITAALEGQLEMHRTCQALEDLLIHFSFAKKVDKKKQQGVPESHIALDPWEYRKGTELPRNMTEDFRYLYDSLCALSHPTSIGLEHLWGSLPDGRYEVKQQCDDKRYILDLIHQHKSTIDNIFLMTTNSAGATLRLLNHFPFPYAYKVQGIDSWRNELISQWEFPIWPKLMNLMACSTAAGGPIS